MSSSIAPILLAKFDDISYTLDSYLEVLALPCELGWPVVLNCHLEDPLVSMEIRGVLRAGYL